MEEDQMARLRNLNASSDMESVSLPLGSLNQIQNYSVFYDKQVNYDKTKIQSSISQIESILGASEISSNKIEKLSLDDLMKEQKYKTSKKFLLMSKLRQSYSIKILSSN